MLRGLHALIVLWSRMPHYLWLAKLMSVRMFTLAASGLYDLVVAPRFALWAKVHGTRAATARRV